MSFALSSSSESEDDNDRFTCSLVSHAKNTEFIQQFKSGSLNDPAEYWPNELHNNNHPHANHSMSMHADECANVSIASTSHQMNGSRILDSSAILNTTPEDDIVLIKVGDKYRQVRVIPTTELLQSAGTPDQRPLVSKKNNNKNITQHQPSEHIIFIW